ncbi:MAG: hypothetical protein DI535_03310 [Citrobacter freundii]|nr:MAG: hypothetical protein DI535_03310 [Citrobacter freundii]
MNLHLVPVKKFRNIFLLVLIANIVLSGITGLLLNLRVHLIPGYKAGDNLTNPLLIFIVIIAVIRALQQRKHLMKIFSIRDFELRLARYEKFYRKRTITYLLSVIGSCLLCLLSQKILFLYYAGLDVLLSLPFYPSAFLLKRELRTNDIILF